MAAGGPAPVIELLIVEDDPGDVLLTREALSGSRVPHNLSVVEDGEAAVAYLLQEGEHADAPRPDLVLLDLNLPRLGGHEVLSRIKSDHALRMIPVVVLTTSHSRDDVRRSYDLHANAYVTKPADLHDFTRIVRQVDDFFLSVAQRPPRV